MAAARSARPGPGWWAAATATAAAGLASEWLAARTVVGWQRPARWLPDLATGWVLVAAAAWVAGQGGRRARLRSPAGALLLLLAAGTWFLATVWPPAQFWHRAPLLHLLASRVRPLPRGRGWVPLLVYAPAAVTGSRLNGLVTGALAAVAVTAVVVTTAGVWRADDLAVVPAGLGWAALLLGSAFVTVTPDALLAGYQVAVAALAVTLAAGYRRTGVPHVTDLVVQTIELGPAGTPRLREALRRAARDRTLDVVGWGPGRVALQHDPGAVDAAALAEAVRAAGALVDSHRALQELLAEEVTEVVASRRRLLQVADEEARRLGDRLRAGPLGDLTRLLEQADQLAVGLAGSPAAAPLQDALDHLRGTVEDLRVLSSGLAPADLDRGLRPALAALAARCPVPVDLGWAGAAAPRYPADVEATVYYVTAEALTNVAKHAGASTCRLDVREDDGWLHWTVTDDGRGGADPRDGSGLQGLVDRVESLGGRLDVVSAPGSGTALTARVSVA